MKNKGITLIALVVTIIILLILAGISISLLIQNGLFRKALEAKEKHEIATKEEQEQLANYSNEIDFYSTRADVNANLEWKKLGTIEGNTYLHNAQTITLPNDYIELCVVFYYDNIYYTSAIIPKFVLLHGKGWRDGYGNSAVYQMYEIVYDETSNTIKLGACYTNGNLINGKLDVYYR